MAVVTFTTDFGDSDAYVGAMKGVVLSLAPNATLVDISHAIPPQDVRTAALILADAAPYFPPGSIHVAVVDPGVGGDRAAIAAAAGGQLFVGPDNGVLSLAATQPRQVFRVDGDLCRRARVSATFHGRDIFAVTAARLAAGHAIAETGTPAAAMIEISMPASVPLADDCRGEVLHVDGFGNLITTFVADAVTGRWQLACGGQRFLLDGGRTFSDVATGALVLYVGSSGRVEVAVRDGSAARLTQARNGSPLHLTRSS